MLGGKFSEHILLVKIESPIISIDVLDLLEPGKRRAMADVGVSARSLRHGIRL